MMVARQATLGRIVEHATEHPAHRVARKNVVSDVICHSVIPVAIGPMPSLAAPWLSTGPQCRLASIKYATAAGCQGQQAVRIIGVWGVEEVEASVARCLRTPPDG